MKSISSSSTAWSNMKRRLYKNVDAEGSLLSKRGTIGIARIEKLYKLLTVDESRHLSTSAYYCSEISSTCWYTYHTKTHSNNALLVRTAQNGFQMAYIIDGIKAESYIHSYSISFRYLMNTGPSKGVKHRKGSISENN